MHDKAKFRLADRVCERRLSPRRTIRLPARIRLDRRPVWLPCVIHDLSATGARLVLPDFPIVPDWILLDIKGLPAPIQCRLIWTDDGTAGFRFIATADGDL